MVANLISVFFNMIRNRPRRHPSGRSTQPPCVIVQPYFPVCANVHTHRRTILWSTPLAVPNRAQSVRPFLHGQYHIIPIHYIVPSHFPGKCSHYLGRIWTSSNILFLGPTRPNFPNGISIQSAVFPEFMIVTNRQTDRQTDRPIDTTTMELDQYELAYAVVSCAIIACNTLQ